MNIPIEKLQGRKIGAFKISLSHIKPLKLHGWFGFELRLFDSKGTLSTTEGVKGIYSKGRFSEIQPWIDFNLRQNVQWPQRKVDLHREGLSIPICQEISKMIPPGGHLMLSYEDPFPLHRKTVVALSKGIPPTLTPLGRILRNCGFFKIKDWYLSESGHEGPRKLWAEKAPDSTWERRWKNELLQELKQFSEKIQ